MNLPILYTFRRCPFAIRARAALFFSKINYEVREVILKNKPPEMLAISKKGTVPVLLINNLVVDESLKIILWALEKNDHHNLLKPYISEKNNTLKLISAIDNEFKFHLDRYKYSARYEKEKNYVGKYKHRDLGLTYLMEIEKRLQYLSFLYEDKLSILDLCIFPLVRQYRIADTDWFTNNKEISEVNKWLDRILNLEFFNIIMKKYKPWNSSQPPVLFSSYSTK